MKKLFGLMLSLMLIVVGCYLIYDSGIRPLIENKQTVEPYDNLTKELLSPGEVFKQGSFIEVDGVEILYDGQYFLVTNNRTDLVRISCSVVGVKKDGTYSQDAGRCPADFYAGICEGSFSDGAGISGVYGDQV